MDLLLPMFTLGLVTSLHCVSMCGPMVVTYALKGTDDETPWRRAIPNLAYQAARIASYMLVGLVLGLVGSALSLDAIRPYTLLAAGLFMIVLGLGMTGKVPWAARLAPRPPKFLIRAITSIRRRSGDETGVARPTLATPIAFGLLTGLMPCAPLIAAELNAAATGSALSGALAMLAFGLGSAPLMLGFGIASSAFPRRFKERAIAVLAIVVMLFGVTYLNRGAVLLGSSVSIQAARNALFGGSADAPRSAYARSADGTVEVPLVIDGTRFVPSTLRVPAGVPVRLVVDRRESNPCSDRLVLPALGVSKDLVPNGTTVVDLPVAKAGSYTLTCGMGMMSGTLVAEGATGPAPRPEAVRPESSSGPGCACCGGGSAQVTEGAAVTDGGVQRITVDTAGGAYAPNVITLSAGVPAEITFRQASGCLGQVMSDDLGFFEDLTTGDVTVRLDDPRPGTYGFSCGMRMVFGTIVVK